MSANPEHFVFKKHDSVGAAAAEDDTKFLDACFVETGDLKNVLDCDNPQRIIVGRTGSGKSALIHRLTRTNPHVIALSPHDLSLNFIATNKVFAFFEAAGLNLAPFYALLWKHLLVVELLKARFQITDNHSQSEAMRRLQELFNKADKYKAQAVDYLYQWGEKFWLTTEQRVHDLTERVEKDLRATVKGGIDGFQLTGEAGSKLAKEERQQIVQHGQDAVSRVQIRELNDMIQVLADNVFDNPMNRYYITIDMLDEDWADARVKFKLIRSLLDVVRAFKVVHNVKIVLAIRQDLLDKVLNLDPTPGFQEEKYKSLYLELNWSKKDLVTVIEKRINQLIRRRYTKGDVHFADVFPPKIDKIDTLDYMLMRTFNRPRDIIVFVNECIGLAIDRPAITAGIVKQAEERYSAERLQSLGHEWSVVWPNLVIEARLFAGMPEHFHVNELSEEWFVERCSVALGEMSDPDTDPISRALGGICGTGGNFASLRNQILRSFYASGLIGLKRGPTDSVAWSRVNDRAHLDAGDIKPSSIVFIHPMFIRALGIRPA